jgi:hypothetical protein
MALARLLKHPVYVRMCVDNTHLLTLLLSNGPSKSYFDPTLVRGHHFFTWALTLLKNFFGSFYNKSLYWVVYFRTCWLGIPPFSLGLRVSHRTILHSPLFSSLKSTWDKLTFAYLFNCPLNHTLKQCSVKSSVPGEKHKFDDRWWVTGGGGRFVKWLTPALLHGGKAWLRTEAGEMKVGFLGCFVQIFRSENKQEMFRSSNHLQLNRNDNLMKV